MSNLALAMGAVLGAAAIVAGLKLFLMALAIFVDLAAVAIICADFSRNSQKKMKRKRKYSCSPDAASLFSARCRALLPAPARKQIP